MSNGREKEGLLYNLFIFSLPLLGLFQLNLIGQLYVHEIILAVVFMPLVILRGGRVNNSVFLFMGMILLWLISQVMTDLIRGTPSQDYLRGWAKIIFFFMSFVSLVLLINTERRALLWISSSIIPLALRPFDVFAGNLDPLVLWKFGVGSAVLMTFCLPALWRLWRYPNRYFTYLYIAGVHFLLGLCSFFLNARSFAGLSLLTGLIVLAYARHGGRTLGMRSILAAGLILVVCVNALATFYSWGASSGVFGSEAQEKYNIQVAYGGGPLVMLLGGRSESLVSTIAISDSPLIGHGSWAKNFEYTAILADLRRQFSEVREGDATSEEFDGLIPTHSYIFGAWVEAGLLGAAFWAFMLIWCVTKVLPRAWASKSALGLYCLMSLPMLFWNVFFSPFGANVRVEVAGLLAIYVYTCSSHRRYP
jgi:hypothetical protein